MESLLTQPVKCLEARVNLVVNILSYKFKGRNIYAKVRNGIINGVTTNISEWYYKHVQHLLKTKGKQPHS